MLRDILNSTGLDTKTCAGLLGVQIHLFEEWVAGQKPIPESFVSTLSTVFGVTPDKLRATRKISSSELGDVTPAIWFRFRGSKFTSADRECVLLIRRVAHLVGQLEEATKNPAVGWHGLFEEIGRRVDRQAPPREQGRQAARMLRESRQLNHGKTGIGGIFRGNIRSMGVLVIETPLPESQIEGCSFYVGGLGVERPALFANTHHSTWFRRNYVLMHELAHAIFDVESAAAAIDFLEHRSEDDLLEERADAFAQEALIPREVLRHFIQTLGINLDVPTPRDLALLVAHTHVELRTVLAAAFEAGFITADQYARYIEYEIASELRRLSDHALSTDEYIKKIGPEVAAAWVGKRSTTIPSRNILLPVPYIKSVLSAVEDFVISDGKAAELLMIDRETFAERFGRPAEAI